MNLLYISNEYPPETGHGGIGTYTRHAAEGLTSRGHRVQVICRSSSGTDETRVQEGVTLHRIVPGGYPLPQSKPFYLFRKLCYSFIPQSLVRLAWAKSAASAYRRLVAGGERFDLIEYPECGAEGRYLLKVNVPTVVRLHTPWEIVHRFDALNDGAFDVALQSHLERTTARAATAVSSPSRALADRMKKQWRLQRIAVYPNGLPVRSYQRARGDAWIYVGRVERRKGVHILLNAYAAVCATGKPPPLILIGKAYGDSYAEQIRSMIQQRGIEQDITWIEGVPGAAVAGHLAKSAVAFFPSLWENFPYACLEAMASGLAVVAARCGGFPEMIRDGVTGILTPPDDAFGLAAAMRRLQSDPGLGARLGDAARDAVRQEFDRDTVCARAEDFYQSIIRRCAA
jgi:glycogen synthase